MVKPNTPTKYVGTDVNLVTNVIRNREPTLADYIQPETGRYYPIWCTWQVGKNPTTGVEGELWVLTKIVANQGYWVKMTSGSGTGPIIGITVPAGTSPVYPDGAGLVNFTSTGNTIDITGSSVDTINFDLANGAAVTAIVGDDGVPVGPDALGRVTLDTLLSANNTYPTPIYTINTAANTETIGYSLSTANATTNNTSYAGLSYFNDAIFTVNASGFVSMPGGNHPVLQSITGDDAVVVYADATGNIDLTTDIVANATNATPIFTTSGGASTETIELQLSTDSATTNNENLAGICYFDDSQFTVNASGYVQYTGATGGTEMFSAGCSVNADNVTGDSTYYTVIFDTEIYDIGGNFNSATGVYTAPSNGYYYFNSNVLLNNVNNVLFIEGYIALITTSQNFAGTQINPSIVYSSAGGTYVVNMQVSSLCYMSAGDTASISVLVGIGGPKTVQVRGAVDRTYFNGWKVA